MMDADVTKCIESIKVFKNKKKMKKCLSSAKACDILAMLKYTYIDF